MVSKKRLAGRASPTFGWNSFHVDGEYENSESESQKTPSSNDVAHGLLTIDIWLQVDEKPQQNLNEKLVDKELASNFLKTLFFSHRVYLLSLQNGWLL
ncbi:hypothetical protein QUB80_25760 [Chlorogloeopsis sp. ULAP01]|uniref:hypothetical protein n=1 Tax=Chlorogloeopsis sp. ULAP01 TaxID=3056483 RepID=UPI0025AB42C6|nr:hypothetical protein [Chlorogloeopsis sp. ULAP01]MDM9384087.1 hypothetical protein [Chlorogloeopsis sp. ULAP01]